MVKGGYMEDVLVAKQPILNKNEEVFAYELLFRGGDPETFNGEKATAEVIINSLECIGLNNLTGGKPVFINFTDKLLKQGIPDLLTPADVYLEVLENVKVDRQLLYSLKTYKEIGFKIVLDDFSFSKDLISLVQLADFVKIDFLMTKGIERQKLIDICRSYNPEIKFIAEKIENYIEYSTAANIGCEYFQGYYFTKPKIVRGKAQNSYSFTFFKIIEELNKREPCFKKIEKIVRNDFAMTYSLLRIINSAWYGYEVNSLHQALVLMGVNRLKKWTALYFLKGFDKDKPSILFETAVFRANFAEYLSDYFSQKEEDSFFVLGLFTVMEAYLDRDIEDILAEVSLNKEFKRALIQKKGRLGDLLNLVENFEKFDFEDLIIFPKKYSLELPVIFTKYQKASEESQKIIKACNEV